MNNIGDDICSGPFLPIGILIEVIAIVIFLICMVQPSKHFMIMEVSAIGQ